MPTNNQEQGLICAYRLSSENAWHALSWQEISDTESLDSSLTWIHLHLSEQAGDWLSQKSGLDPMIAADLMDEDNQPRLINRTDGLFLTLRGVNLNPGADPEDMVFLNIWADSKQIITIRSHRLQALADVRRSIDTGIGMPHTIGGFLVRIMHNVVTNMDPVLTRLDDKLDQLEEETLSSADTSLGARLSALRQDILLLRRHIAPQRRVFGEIQQIHGNWFSKNHRRTLQEVVARVQQDVDELDSYRDRALLVQDELNRQSDQKMNATMYRLTVITGIFLPLSFLTGLLGINVGGMPGVENPMAFWLVVGVSVLLGVGGVILARVMKWF
ncbi:MAG: hypothetical protein HQL54_08035 [Magnetococcales bacterium]|nr:hypothetical protein [Magnetococcales bacterium]